MLLNFKQTARRLQNVTPSAAPSKVSWSSTIQLPRSTLPARPPIQRPSPFLRAVTDDLYTWNISRPDSETTGTFVLHDGPPYANGPLHIGHALNKVLKDIINRFWLSQGKRIRYIPGWDCHGLPIELKALQAEADKRSPKHSKGGNGGSRLTTDPVAVRRAARKLASKTIKEQMDGFKQWGVMGDWNGAYRTMDKDFELRQLDVFKRMVEKGLIYRRNKPVYWSPSSKTALAEAELEYTDDHRSTAAFVAFPMLSMASDSLYQRFKNVSLVVWTTTPWTLPANRAIGINKGLFYTVLECRFQEKDTQRFVVEESRVQHLQDHITQLHPDASMTMIMTTVSGASLLGATYGNPLIPGQRLRVFHADFVTAASGTGLVHMAPGHGHDDYEVCKKHDIEPFAPVDEEGRFVADAIGSNLRALAGKDVQTEGVSLVLEHLRQQEQKFGMHFLLATHQYRHRYPIDWRTKKPVIIRATEQWFADVGSIKEAALNAADKATFIPPTGHSRLRSFVSGRSEWCVSRQRAWGVPIPALYRESSEGGGVAMDSKTIAHIIKVVAERGTDAWWSDAEDEPAWIPPHLQGTYRRGKDTMDVWFDSGTSWTLLSPRSRSAAKADLYLEGTDQHRGWFQSSLLTHVANGEAGAPAGTFITHGFTLDQSGKKMSKSLGNVISPDEIMNGTLVPPQKGKKKQTDDDKPLLDAWGPDALRLWVASSDYTNDVVVGQQVLRNVNLALSKYRGTLKWLLGCLKDFDAVASGFWSIPWTQKLTLMDRIALLQLEQVESTVYGAYVTPDGPRYEVFKAAKAIETYVNSDLSQFYFETLKDRLYCGTTEDRTAAHMVLCRIFYDLLGMLAPVTPFVVEETWKHTPAGMKTSPEGRDLHPLKTRWVPYQSPFSTGCLKDQLALIGSIHNAVKIALEQARSAKLIGSSLEGDAVITLDPALKDFDLIVTQEVMDELASVLVVSGARVEVVSPDHVRGRENGATDPRASSSPSDDISESQIPGRSSALSQDQTFSAPIEHMTNTIGQVEIRRAAGHKCPRCWRHVAEQEGELCGRCESAVRETEPVQ